MRGVGRAVVTLRHGIDVESTAAERCDDRDAVRDELGIGADEFVIGTVANFRPQKDYPNLLRAAGIARGRTHPDVGWSRSVKGPQEAEIRALHARAGARRPWCRSPASATTPCG